jgi:Pyruvate/2-oxoacid:ferredoxin oxidoreductase delta subunit
MKAAAVAALPVIDVAKCTDCRKCVAACPKGAIFEPQNVGCAKCVQYCLSLEVDCRRQKPMISTGRCDSCGLCLAVCPVDAIAWTCGPH